jgi:hypothetical protein
MPPATPAHQQPDQPEKTQRGFDYWRVHVKNDTNIARYNLTKENHHLPTESEAVRKREEMDKEAKVLREYVRKALETKFVAFAQRNNLTYCGMRVMSKSHVFRAIRHLLQ